MDRVHGPHVGPHCRLKALLIGHAEGFSNYLVKLFPGPRASEHPRDSVTVPLHWVYLDFVKGHRAQGGVEDGDPCPMKGEEEEEIGIQPPARVYIPMQTWKNQKLYWN